jgi:hypothetical protein
MLGESTYWLTNIKVTSDEYNLTVSADIIKPEKDSAASNSTEVLGHITTITTIQEGEWKGQGELVIDRGQDVGSYQLLLNMLH